MLAIIQFTEDFCKDNFVFKITIMFQCLSAFDLKDRFSVIVTNCHDSAINFFRAFITDKGENMSKKQEKTTDKYMVVDTAESRDILIDKVSEAQKIYATFTQSKGLAQKNLIFSNNF